MPSQDSAGDAVDRSSEVGLDELPEELASRVRAACAHADHRTIHRRGEGYEVYAEAGDRIVLMTLEPTANNAVAETTHAFLRADIVDVRMQGSDGEVEIVHDGHRQRLTVPLDVARRIDDLQRRPS